MIFELVQRAAFDVVYDPAAFDVTWNNGVQDVVLEETILDVTMDRASFDVVFNGPQSIANIVTIPDATETIKGKAELATVPEAQAFVDDERIVTPLKMWRALVDRQSISTTPVTLTITAYRHVVLVDATASAIFVTLPTAVGNEDRIFIFKKTAGPNGNPVTIQADTSELIDGASSQVLTRNLESIEVVSDGVAWHIIG